MRYFGIYHKELYSVDILCENSTEIEIEISLLTKSGPPGGHIQITIMIDTH
jgi:hypothetical protein